MTPDPMLDEQETAWDAAMKAHEATLVVGTRVIAQASPECQARGSLMHHCYNPSNPTERPYIRMDECPSTCRDVWHWPWLKNHAVIGTVDYITEFDNLGDHHVYRVRFDAPVPKDIPWALHFNLTEWSGWFCSGELLVLRAADPDDGETA